MELRDSQGFQHHYPKYGQRLNNKKEWRVSLRILEAQINQRLDAFHIAPVFIESWTRRKPLQPDFDYLPRSTLSVRMYNQMLEDAAKFRWRFPVRAGSCSCPRNTCMLGQCPCLTFKEKGAVMLCGQACGCDDSCPSSYLKEERQIPLVLFHTHYKGWGVFTPVEIPAGTFLGLYAGHIVDVRDEPLFDNTYVFDVNQQVENHSRKYAIDATWSGNISRFFNHSCVDPTLVAKVLFTRGNLVVHDLAFFTTRHVHIANKRSTVKSVFPIFLRLSSIRMGGCHGLRFYVFGV
ncbi:SET domain protein [Oesophagostomum dentatum]|uniref:SET domain protein n=1 Tax=Oesophagostomum dentatum TaxID=61180 RepID=A0A0B1SWX1_OESDE|nr:SET domain protein [Oesophagostomum dentatum]